MLAKRIPTIEEAKVIDFMIKRSSVHTPKKMDDSLMVKSMEDGGMRSLLLFPKHSSLTGRVFGRTISEFQFTDADGVEVIVSLNVDNNEDLFELDVWKTDFTPLIKFPKEITEG